MELNPVVVDVTRTTLETLFLPPGVPYEKRITRFYEIELITGGVGSMVIGNEKYCTMRGNIFFRKPGTVTQGIAGYYSHGIAFDPVRSPERESFYSTTIPYWITDNSSQLMDYGCFDQFPACYLTREITKLEVMFKEVVELCKEDRDKNQNAMRCIMEQIMQIIEKEWTNGEAAQVKNNILRHYDLILSCKEYIDSNLQKHFTLTDLAAHCGLSKNFFSKIFKEITGMTAFEYINENRMQLAKKLILTTNISIDQIVTLCGFEDRTYFYKVFKKRFHSAPTVYRKNYITQSRLNIRN